ncbi:MAG TPA: biopolymer transporter ExbD [Phycisphaerales bacterium]|nr:biopolymer transporter ExbD [Phycisphaerales bacterium]
MSRRTRRRLDIAELRLPLVALIDVVLFLLFYFIIAGNLADEESELSSALQVQKAAAGASALHPQVLRVEPAEGGAVRYMLGDRDVRSRATLLNLLSALPKEPGVSIRVDGRVPVEAAAAAIQAARDAGFTKITYVAGE